jgi:hypothetical protein
MISVAALLYACSERKLSSADLSQDAAHVLRDEYVNLPVGWTEGWCNTADLGGSPDSQSATGCSGMKGDTIGLIYRDRHGAVLVLARWEHISAARLRQTTDSVVTAMSRKLGPGVECTDHDPLTSVSGRIISHRWQSREHTVIVVADSASDVPPSEPSGPPGFWVQSLHGTVPCGELALPPYGG